MGKKVGLYHLSLISRLNSITLINCCSLVKSCKHDSASDLRTLTHISQKNYKKREDISRKSTTQLQFYPGPVMILATTATGLGLANLVWSSPQPCQVLMFFVNLTALKRSSLCITPKSRHYYRQSQVRPHKAQNTEFAQIIQIKIFY